MKQTFKDILQETPKPKQLDMYERLPHVFDLFYDVKYYFEFATFKGLTELPQEDIRLLAEHGYDTTTLPSLRDIQNNRDTILEKAYNIALEREKKERNTK
jgi:hypothetical protein